MYVTMNRFHVREGREREFEEMWRTRDSHLAEVEGFVEFRFLRGPEGEYISHTTWESEEAFERWVGSEAFRKAHARAAGTPQDFFRAPGGLTCYEVVLRQEK